MNCISLLPIARVKNVVEGDDGIPAFEYAHVVPFKATSKIGNYLYECNVNGEGNLPAPQGHD
jgi:hypothetical protein